MPDEPDAFKHFDLNGDLMPDSSYQAPMKQCAQRGCEEEFRDHQWGQTEAHNAGWFHQRDGRSWCPAHHPSWVAEWRAKRAAGIPPEPWRRG